MNLARKDLIWGNKAQNCEFGPMVGSDGSSEAAGNLGAQIFVLSCM